MLAVLLLFLLSVVSTLICGLPCKGSTGIVWCVQAENAFIMQQEACSPNLLVPYLICRWQQNGAHCFHTKESVCSRQPGRQDKLTL